MMTGSKSEPRISRLFSRVLICAVLLAASATVVWAQTPGPWSSADDVYWSSKFGLPGIDQAGVRALAGTATDIYTGGDFTMAGGVRVNGIARFSKASGTWHALGSGVEGIVTALCVDGSDVFVAGTFFRAGGVAARGIARWDGSSWSALKENGAAISLQGTISALAIVGDRLYVGGAYTLSASTKVLRCVACWNRGTGVWSELDGGIANPIGGLRVSSIAVRDRSVFIGGEFSQAGRTALPANNVAVWDDSLSTWALLGSAGANGVQGPVTMLARSGDDIIVGGRFTFTGTTAARNIARWNVPLQQWSAFGGGLREVPAAAVASAPGLWVALSENDPAGRPRWGLISWTGSAWDVPSAANGSVNALLLAGDTLVAGGEFTEIGGVSARYLVRRNNTPWSDFAAPLSAGRSAAIHSVVVSGNDVFVGGTYSTIDGRPMNNIARWNRTTGTWSMLGTDTANGVNGDVYAIRVLGDRVFVGGFFGVAGNVPARNIASFRISQQRWEALAESSDPSREGTDGAVQALAVDAATGSVYAGGAFTIAGADTVLGMAQWKTGTQEWVKIDDALDVPYSFATIDAMDCANGTLFVGGTFQPKVSLAKTMVARRSHSVWYSLADNIDGSVNAICALSDSAAVIGGEFSVFGNGQNITNLARWDYSRTRIDNVGGGVGGQVRALAREGGSIFAGGNFLEAAGIPAASIARWDGAQWRALGSGTDGHVHALACGGNHLFVGGDFLAAGGKTAYHFSEFDNSVLEVEHPSAASDAVTLSLFPLPVRDAATIRVRLRNTEDASIRIYDALGRLVASPHDGPLGVGSHSLRWDATTLPSGVYLVTVVTSSGVRTQEITIAR